MLRNLAAIMLLGLVTACGGQYVESPIVDPTAEIRATDATEDIAALMEEYADALESLDTDRIDALMSRDYYENSGTTDTTADDYGYATVPEMYATLRDHVEDVRVELSIHDIIVEDDRADVLFEYSFTMLYVVGDESRWETDRDVNRIQLRHEGAGWRIVSGL